MDHEDRKVLYEVLERVTSVDVKMDCFAAWRDKHEQDDTEKHDAISERAGKIEKTQTQLRAYYAAAAVLIPAVMWALGVFTKGAAAQ
jgi:hypothetical protein